MYQTADGPDGVVFTVDQPPGDVNTYVVRTIKNIATELGLTTANGGPSETSDDDTVTVAQFYDAVKQYLL